MSDKTNLVRNVFFVIGIVVILIMIHSIGFDAIYRNLKQTGWWFVAIIGVWVFVYLINALSFHAIIRDGSPESEKISFWRTLKLVISGYAINYTTPVGILGGEPYRILELKPALGVKKATSSVLLYAMMHFVSHLILWLLAVPLLVLTVPSVKLGVEIILWIVLAGSIFLIIWAFKVYKTGLIKRALSIGKQIPFLKKRLRKIEVEKQEQIEELDGLISHLYNNRRKAFFFSLCMETLSRLVGCLEVFFMIYSVGYAINYVQCVIIVAFASLFANLLFFSPMQLGTREGGYAIALKILAIPSGLGIYVSLCTRIRELFWIVVGILIMKYKSLK
ncbi:lysylphosphatidylglycerol synthase transmembrane domain-containing protein [Parabacteroides pacaensis]|uniref:lysylphosphatidylglycerol synthase transmembrane domain-containing protein n=1 Tax=Parabacteroides pacaensis TaxID=2086575 RepID=UPI000D0F9D54|nr:lysylphosphatidylglycerol synthase transmembrane domain-containing protein [Parabacteroides pacaensis]